MRFIVILEMKLILIRSVSKMKLFLYFPILLMENDKSFTVICYFPYLLYMRFECKMEKKNLFDEILLF